jgi:DNA-directed RNA polymerase subunit RPC12/RpoP
MNIWQCEACGMSFEPQTDADVQCSKCGDRRVKKLVYAHDELILSCDEHVDLKSKDPSLPSHRKLRRHLTSGIRPEGSGSGRIVEERRELDHDADTYTERVVDVEISQVIVDKKERLSEHRGGSEKHRRQDGK